MSDVRKIWRPERVMETPAGPHHNGTLVQRARIMAKANSTAVLSDRLLDKVRRSPSGCWEWTGPPDRKGYGRIQHQGKTLRAHKASYLVFCGPVPEGLCVCHRCDNPRCANPTHLFLGTVAANNHDRDAKGRGADRRGERHGQARLTAGAVLDMRERAARGESYASIGRLYGVSGVHARRVVVGAKWGHV